METRIYDNGYQLANMLMNVKGAQQFTLVTCTVPSNVLKKSRKTGIPFAALFKGTVYKTAKRHATIGVGYGSGVNGRREKEGLDRDFEAMPLPFGEWRNGSRIVLDYKGIPYVRITYLNANSDKGTAVYHYADGEVLDEALVKIFVEEFLPVKKPSTRQGVENPVVVNSILADNIMRLRINGEEWVHRIALARGQM